MQIRGGVLNGLVMTKPLKYSGKATTDSKLKILLLKVLCATLNINHLCQAQQCFNSQTILFLTKILKKYVKSPYVYWYGKSTVKLYKNLLK